MDPALSSLYSWKNDDENFGVLISAAASQTEYQRNGIETLLAWGEIVPTTFQQDRQRTAINLATQYRPMDYLEFGLTFTSLDLNADNANTSIFLFPTQQGESRCHQVNAAGICTDITHSGVNASAFAQTWARKAEMSSETYDFDVNFEADNFILTGRIGNTSAKGGTSLTSNYGNSIGQESDFAGHYDATGDKIIIDTANKVFNSSDFNGELTSAEWALKKQPNTDEETYAQFDVTIPLDFEAITAFKTGIRYADHDVTQQTDQAIVGILPLAMLHITTMEPCHPVPVLLCQNLILTL